MKLFLATLLLALVLVVPAMVHVCSACFRLPDAFQQHQYRGRDGCFHLGRIPHQSSTRLAARPDASQAIQEALRVTKEKGARSAEARVAWEAVEEMDSSDVSPALSVPLVVDGQTPATMSPEQVREWDYAHRVSALAHLLQDSAERVAQIRTLVESLRDLELDDPALSKWDDRVEATAHLKAALQEAKAAAEVHGPTSPQAAEAWNRVEECAADEDGCSVETHYRYSAAALKAHHLYDAVIDSSLLREALDALGTLDGLRRSIQIENTRLRS